MEMEDAARCGHPSAACDDDHAALISVLLEDRHLTCEELTEQAAISSSVHLILTEKLHIQKIAANNQIKFTKFTVVPSKGVLMPNSIANFKV